MARAAGVCKGTTRPVWGESPARPEAQLTRAAPPAAQHAATRAGSGCKLEVGPARGRNARRCIPLGWREGHLAICAASAARASWAAALGCGRSGKQVRERYMYIKPGQNTGPWTEEEECELDAHHARLGNRWAEIARLMHRPDNMVKNRYYGRQKAALKKAGALQVMPCEPEDVCDAPGAVL